MQTHQTMVQFSIVIGSTHLGNASLGMEFDYQLWITNFNYLSSRNCGSHRFQNDKENEKIIETNFEKEKYLRIEKYSVSSLLLGLFIFPVISPNDNNSGGYSKYSVREVQYFYLGNCHYITHSSLEWRRCDGCNVASPKPTSTAEVNLFASNGKPCHIFKQHIK